MSKEMITTREETFAPILYVMPYREFDEAIALQNGVPQGLSSAVFTGDVREDRRFDRAMRSIFARGTPGTLWNILIISQLYFRKYL